MTIDEELGGGESGGGFRRDPTLEALFQHLPAPDSEWSIEKRARWLRAIAHVFEVVYPREDGDGRSVKIEIHRNLPPDHAQADTKKART